MSTSRSAQRTLLLIAVLFLTPFLVAVALRFGGWQPSKTRNYGALLAPPISLEGVRAQRSDGSPWPFVNAEQEWTLLLRVPSVCDAACMDPVTALPNVKLSLGRQAHRLHLFALTETAPVDGIDPLRLDGEVPSPLRQPAPAAEVYLVDPHGYLVLHYPPGFVPRELRRDLSRLIK